MKGLRPEQAMAFDAAEFARVVMIGIAAGESGDDASLVVDRPAPDGSVEVLEVPDNPHSKAAFALRRHYARDDRAFASALMRFRAFMGLLARGGLEGWVQRRSGGRLAIHPAALDVASQLKISRNGRFAPRKFQQAMAEVAAVHYRDLEGWGRPGEGSR
jgi:hypothetical protein